MRFSSDFFKAYNDEIDTQRRRRSENSQAFSQYVKAQQDAGREVSVEELERMRNNLAGGDAYMAGGLPSQVALKSMSERTKEAAEAKRQADAQTALQNVQKNIDLVKSVSAGLVGVDVTTPEGQKKAQSIFTDANIGDQAQQYASLIPGFVQGHQLTSLQNFKDTMGWANIETEDEMNAIVSQAPAWGRAMLKSEFKAKRTRLANTEGQQAISAIDFGSLAQSARGNREAAYGIAQNQFISTTGRQPNAVEQSRMRQAIDGYVAFERTSTTEKAMSNFTSGFTSEQLLAMSQDEATRDAMIRNALAQQGLTAPTEDDMRQARTALIPLTANARKLVVTSSVDKVINGLSGIGFEQLQEIDSTQELENYIDTLMSQSSFSVGNMTEQERMEAKSRIRSSLQSYVDIANKAERAEDEVAFRQEVMSPDGDVIAAMRQANVPNRKENVRRAMDTKREAHNLPPISDQEFNKLWNELSLSAVNAAALRYEQGVKNARTTADSLYDEMITSQVSNAEILLKESGPATAAVAQSLLKEYVIPPGMVGMFSVAVNDYVDREGVEASDPQAIMNATAALAPLLGLKRQGQAAREDIYRKVLADQDLVKPGTDSMSYFTDHIDQHMMAKAEQIAAFIATLPVDDTSTAQQKVAEFEQAAIEYIEMMNSELSDDAYSFLLANHNTILIQQRLGETLKKARELINTTERKGTFSFLNYDRAKGIFRVMSPDPEVRAKAEAAGLNPDFVYRKLPDGTFERVTTITPNPAGEGYTNTGYEGMTQQEIIERFAPYN